MATGTTTSRWAARATRSAPCWVPARSWSRTARRWASTAPRSGTKASPGVAESPESEDFFGLALTTGDYDGDGYDDLAIGAHTEDRSPHVDSGIVQVLRGSGSGLTAMGNVILEQDTSRTVAGSPDDFDYWGYALTSGDYDGDGFDDLAVGAPYDSDGGVEEGGVVNVFYGTASGPSTTGDMFFHQSVTAIDDASEAFDHFGFALR